MEQNRNIDFDSEVEIHSLKDAVWRLTTRVYLLEDFIAERFGEIISPGGFTKKATTALNPGTSCSKPSTKRDDVRENPISTSQIYHQKEREEASFSYSSETERESNEMEESAEENENFESNHEKNIVIQGLEFEQGGNDPLLIPKNEEIGYCHDGHTNDYFLNAGSDGRIDSSENDPGFNPLSDVSVTDGARSQIYDRGPGSSHHNRKTEKDKEAQFFCPICGKGFTQSANLKIHCRSHTGEKPYSCTICEKTFTQQTGLNYHLRTHTGEKPFQCTVCYKQFSVSSNLHRHMKTHR